MSAFRIANRIGWAWTLTAVIALCACQGEDQSEREADDARDPRDAAGCAGDDCSASSGDGHSQRPLDAASMPQDAALAQDAGPHSAEDGAVLPGEPVDPACVTITTHARITTCLPSTEVTGCENEPAFAIATGTDLDDDGSISAHEAELARDVCRHGTSCDYVPTGATERRSLALCDFPGGDFQHGFLAAEQAMSDLSGANLTEASCGSYLRDFYEGDFCHLECAKLRGANLASSSLAHVRLGGADLRDADLSGASLVFAMFSNVVATNASFRAAAIIDTDLQGADLSGADFAGARLERSRTLGLVGCPATLPNADWTCRELIRAPCDRGPRSFVMFGPTAQLAGADLSGQDLSALMLAGASLARAELDGADLSAATLIDVELIGADLSSAVLAGANLQHARAIDLPSCPALLPDADWSCLPQPINGRFLLAGPAARFGNRPSGTPPALPDLVPPETEPRGDVREVDFSAAHLAGADFRRVNADRARLVGADLRGARFAVASLVGADLSGANLAGADLSATSAAGASFRGADLRDAVLDYASLEGADLSGARLMGASFRQTLLSGANLEGADLSGALVQMGGNARTRAVDLLACPAALPSAEYRCVAQTDGRFALIGARLSVADVALSPVDLSGMNLEAVDFTGANLAGVDLTNVNFRCVVTSDDLGRTRAVDLLACPAALPSAEYRCVAQTNDRFALIGAQLSVADTELSPIDLSGMNLEAVNFNGANLAGVELTNVSLRGALTASLIGSPHTDASTICPNGEPGPCTW